MRLRLGPDDLGEGEMRGYLLAGERYLLLVRLGGSLHALDDVCNHAGCLLSRGRLDGSQVICPCHQMGFDVRSGALTCLPRLCEDQPTYPVEVEGGAVWVEVE
ncbi:MAG TPA: Rieske 2Fe-2S domain-containing protein [Anaeromyxobacteraceae bacterium]|nr:Rieske 2Fe-2S domain-containing protein [Anaeromyxobacteraceae bacterium]